MAILSRFRWGVTDDSDAYNAACVRIFDSNDFTFLLLGRFSCMSMIVAKNVV